MSSLLLTKIFINFSKRVPSIKFKGPRVNLPKTESVTKIESLTKHNKSEVRNLSDLSKLPAMHIPSVRGALLNSFDMQVVNSGGFCDDSCKKVKRIKLTQ